MEERHRSFDLCLIHRRFQSQRHPCLPLASSYGYKLRPLRVLEPRGLPRNQPAESGATLGLGLFDNILQLVLTILMTLSQKVLISYRLFSSSHGKHLTAAQLPRPIETPFANENGSQAEHHSPILQAIGIFIVDGT